MHSILSVLVFLAACAAATIAENHMYNALGARILFKPKISLTTQTTTTTSTFVVSCTQLVANACPARRSSYDNEEQFPVIPTAVQGVVATPVPSRTARSADPQYFMSPLPYYSREIQSGINVNPFNYQSISLRDGSYPQPAAGQQRIFGVSLNGNPAGSFFGNQNYFPALPGVVYTFTSTFTITSFTVTTSTSTPACFKAGLLQCPP